MNKEQKQFLLSSLFSGIMIGIGCTRLPLVRE